MQSFIFIPLWLLKRRFFNFFFEKLAFRLPCQPIKISDLDKMHMLGRGLLKKPFCKKNQNICSNTEINANFHYSHCKSMETLSCHSNKNTIHVVANVMSMYVKFQLHPQYGF